jgi:hypothetical protein
LSAVDAPEMYRLFSSKSGSTIPNLPISISNWAVESLYKTGLWDIVTSDPDKHPTFELNEQKWLHPKNGVPMFTLLEVWSAYATLAWGSKMGPQAANLIKRCFGVKDLPDAAAPISDEDREALRLIFTNAIRTAQANALARQSGLITAPAASTHPAAPGTELVLAGNVTAADTLPQRDLPSGSGSVTPQVPSPQAADIGPPRRTPSGTGLTTINEEGPGYASGVDLPTPQEARQRKGGRTPDPAIAGPSRRDTRTDVDRDVDREERELEQRHGHEEEQEQAKVATRSRGRK